MRPDSDETKFRRGASSMVSAVFISRILGIALIVPMQNLIGNYALGLYQLVYPLYTVMITLSTAGFPLALSKSISDFVAQGKLREASHMFSIVGRFLMLLGIPAFLIMWFAGPYLVGLSVPGDAMRIAAIPAIRALAPALLLLPLMSAQRGYLQGNFRLKQSGASQVVEQITRVVVVLLALIIAVKMGAGPTVTAAIATFGATAGAITAFMLLLQSVKKMRRETLRRLPHLKKSALRARPILRNLFAMSLPITLGTLVLPISQTIDGWTVPRVLVTSGATLVSAFSQYGVYSGEALRLIQLPLSFATAIGTSALPAISESVTLRNPALTRTRLHQALHMSTLIALPAFAVLFTMARPIDIALFRGTDGVTLMKATSIIVVLSGLELVSTYILQGYNAFYRPVVHMAAGAVLKLALNLTLIPIYGIAGAAYASIAEYALSSWLNMALIRRISGLRISYVKLSVRPFLATLVFGAWLYGIERVGQSVAHALTLDHSRLLALAILLLGLALGIPIYLLSAFFFKASTLDELVHLPLVGRLISRFLRA